LRAADVAAHRGLRPSAAVSGAQLPARAVAAGRTRRAHLTLTVNATAGARSLDAPLVRRGAGFDGAAVASRFAGLARWTRAIVTRDRAARAVVDPGAAVVAADLGLAGVAARRARLARQTVRTAGRTALIAAFGRLPPTVVAAAIEVAAIDTTRRAGRTRLRASVLRLALQRGGRRAHGAAVAARGLATGVEHHQAAGGRGCVITAIRGCRVTQPVADVTEQVVRTRMLVVAVLRHGRRGVIATEYRPHHREQGAPRRASEATSRTRHRCSP
jgi:hypothetical protein